MIEHLTPEQEANFNGALLGILVQRLGGSVRIDTEAFDAFIDEPLWLDIVGDDDAITLTLRPTE